MNEVLYRPTSALAGLVDFIWAADDYVAQAPRERVLPNGAPTLVLLASDAPLCTYADEAAPATPIRSGAVLSGGRQTPLIIGTSLGATVGVHFKPGGARAFFDARADELAEQIVSLDVLWGAAAGLLQERIREAGTQLERAQILERVLLEQARHSLELEPVLRVALEAFERPDLTSVTEVNQQTGLSPKRLIALFHDKIGLSPKTYWRVRRFRAALRDLELGVSGAALAHHHGYCDQAHFLRDFRTFAGACPTQYLDTRVIGSDHVSLYARRGTAEKARG